MLANADGAIVVVNRELERMFGYPRTDLIGRSIDALVPDASRAAHAEWRRAFAGGPEQRPMGEGRELFGRRRDGSQVRIEVGLTPLRLREAGFVLASLVDITERHRAEQALHSAIEERLEFEELVSELGAEFVMLAPDVVDRHIEDALGRMVRTLGLDRSALFVVDDDGDFVHTHQWTHPGLAQPLGRVSAREQFPWHLAQVRAGTLVQFATLEEVPDETDRGALDRLGTQSGVTVPMAISGSVCGAMSFAAVRHPRTWPAAVLNRLRVVALIFANALARKQADDALQRQLAAHLAIEHSLRDENTYLRSELRTLTGAPAIVAYSPGIRRVLERVRQVAPTETTVLLIGETGTGKTLLAQRIHELSARRTRAMVRVTCATQSAIFTERELLGAGPRQGRWLDLASGSTVCLDDVADLTANAQAVLARVLRDRHLQAGSDPPVPIDVRFIAATRHDLTQSIADGAFRDDLYHQLNVFPIVVPPLRERPQDIVPLMWRFVDEFAEHYGKPVDAIDAASVAGLQRHPWRGNARELRNVVERAVIAARDRQLRIEVPAAAPVTAPRDETLTAVERQHILALIAECDGRIGGDTGAAHRLGLTVPALRARMIRLGLRGPRS